MPRLFTGIEIPPSIGFALSLKRGGLHGARWIDPQNYHITLRYIGEVDHRSAQEALDALDRAGYREPFTITLDRLAVFGGNKPRALYAGVVPHPELLDLQAEHERLLHRVALLSPQGRKFLPHVTLARLRDTAAREVAAHIAASGRFEPLSFSVRRFVVYSSRESGGGGPYIVEQDYPLAA
ncbi:RNA 2',3'-cyclic phosphodiesterase [Pelagibacterium montanilacus]|uniref:RNA 2',3'-cyclic phosphodiesterase n=1 Tax=Pelagibacterium montanilacus TaxID=2185280 RepID=UPI000F8E7EF8|nr:RNA 2',3'-cyclic phosphodiesterase [Pelagibacterium montanilacus]